MRMSFLCLTAFALLLALTLGGKAAPSCPPAPKPVILSPVHVVDVEAGTVRRNRALVLAGGLVADEMRAEDLPRAVENWPGAERRDGGGFYAIPGLWDMHVHTLWDEAVPPVFFNAFLAHGVTAVRDMGGDLGIAQSVRKKINECAIAAPHLWFPGPFLDGPEPINPSLSIALGTPEDARKAVRKLKTAEVDFLKVYTLLPPNVLEVLAGEARAAGLPIAGHLPIGVTAQDAARLGFASIEHLAIGRGGLCPEEGGAVCDAAYDALIAAHVAQTPTLVVRHISTEMAATDFAEPPGVSDMPDAVLSYWHQQRAAAQARDAEWQAARARSLVHAARMTRELSARGAVILAGSDAGNPYVVPGESLHRELELLVEAGLTPLQALQAATVTAARFMKWERAGAIKKGFDADLVLLEANPLEDISNTRTIRAVYRGGRKVAGTRDRQPLDK